jgi:hypothetical protein
VSVLSQVVPARAGTARDLPALETAMQGLALDERSPVALEIAATKTERRFLLRAEEEGALHHLEHQIQARYPQAVMRAVEYDPWRLDTGEEASLWELRPGASSDLPLRTWRTREWVEEGTDPVLGILAACGDLPEEVRVVVQLALVPAPATWSARYARRAVEHPLEKEHQKAMQVTKGAPSAPGFGRIAALFVLVLLLLVVTRWQKTLVPVWLSQAVQSLLHGRAPALTFGEGVQLFLGVSVLLSLCFGVVVLLSRGSKSAIYNQRLVEEKTARPAYRVRLRLLVVERGVPVEGQMVARRRSVRQTLRRWDAIGLSPLPPFRVVVAALVRGCQHQQARVQTRLKLRRERRTRRQAREAILRRLVAAYRQYHLASGGYFVPRRIPARLAHCLLAPVSRRFLMRRGWSADLVHSTHLLSVTDVAALWHLPQAHDLADLSFVERESARTLLAPARLAHGPGYPLGISSHAGEEVQVVLPYACLRQNLLVAASTGKGKSTLFEHLVRAYAQARVNGEGKALGLGGLLLVDPHGDLAEQVAGVLPASLVDEIVLVRLSDREHPIGFNPLDLSAGQDRDKVVDNLISVIEALWPTSYGPRTESFVEYGSKTLAEANLTLIERDPHNGPDAQFTLLDVVPLFRQEDFRGGVLELVKDEVLRNWWKNYYDQLDGRQQAEFTSSVVTKLSKFASNRISRRILGQPRSSLILKDLIAQDRITLLSCGAGDVGGDLAALFGSLFVGFFQTALSEQASLSQDERHRVLVLIDEFQSLAGINYQTMLAELRKYGGSFGLATQSMAYLDRFERTLRATVLANVDHLFAFTMADEDARLLRLPGVEPEDLTQLPDYTCYARLSLSGERLPLFSVRLAPPEASSPEQRKEVEGRSRQRYGRPVGEVDQRLREAQARQRTLRPANKRKGRKGYEVLWEGKGEERVEEVLKGERGLRDANRRGKKGRHEKAELHPEHTMYEEEGSDA